MRKGKRLVLAALTAGMLAGCGQTDEVDRSVEIQEETVHENSFELTPVTRGTVQQPLVLNCDYSQTVEVDLYFAVDQEVITDVYVEKGDIVKKGNKFFMFLICHKSTNFFYCFIYFFRIRKLFRICR